MAILVGITLTLLSTMSPLPNRRHDLVADLHRFQNRGIFNLVGHDHSFHPSFDFLAIYLEALGAYVNCVYLALKGIEDFFTRAAHPIETAAVNTAKATTVIN